MAQRGAVRRLEWGTCPSAAIPYADMNAEQPVNERRLPALRLSPGITGKLTMPSEACIIPGEVARRKMRLHVEDIARRAAQRLSAELDRNLPALVEAELQGGKPPERFDWGTTIALAGLIVSAAQLKRNA